MLRLRFLAPWVAVAVLVATPGAAGAEELIVDNTAAQVQIKGRWDATKTTGGFVGDDYLFRVAGEGAHTVTWPFPAGAAGRYEVFARWSGGPNRATNATYQVFSNAGTANVT